MGVYRTTVKKVAPALAGKSLGWVADHRREIEDLINGLRGTTYHRRLRAIIVGCCNTAVKAGDIHSHRLRGLDIGKDVRVTPAKFYPASDEEIERLATEIGPDYALLICLGRYAGLRIGEALGVNRADVIAKRSGNRIVRVLRVSRQRMADGSLDVLKSKQAHESRDIPLVPVLADMLASAPADAEGYYFPHAWRGSAQKRFLHARKRAGLPDGFTFHKLRHIFASDAISRGVPLTKVSTMLGHMSVDITSKIYVHWLPADDDAILAMLSA
jgi:integrase